MSLDRQVVFGIGGDQEGRKCKVDGWVLTGLNSFTPEPRYLRGRGKSARLSGVVVECAETANCQP
jgi:hypothetical protein